MATVVSAASRFFTREVYPASSRPATRTVAAARGADTGGACDDIKLLFDENGAQARTFVLGFACTAGTDDGVATELYLDRLALACSSPETGTFAADLLVSAGGANPGNQCTPNALSARPAVAEPGGLDADTYLYQVASTTVDNVTLFIAP